MSNLLNMVSRDVQLKRVSFTGGGECCGPCPNCGGRDRFRVWPERGRYWCRQCRRKGDAIQYLRDFRGLSFIEAKQALGLNTRPLGRGEAARCQAHQIALAAAREAYKTWQREKFRLLLEERDQLRAESEIAATAYRLLCRRSGLLGESEAQDWQGKLANIYDRLAFIEYELDLLTYREYEIDRATWWRQEEAEDGRPAAA